MRDARLLLLIGLWGLSGCATTGAHRGMTEDQPLAEFAWLAGSWVEVEGEMRMEEHWTLPCGGVMLGTSRTVNQGKLAYFEYIRIEDTPNGVVYVAHPRGGSPTRFPLVESPTDECHRAVFENLKHDHPQRIIYESRGRDTLYIRIEGEPEEGPAEEDWLMRRLGSGQCAWAQASDETPELWRPFESLARRAYSAARVATIIYRFEGGLSSHLVQGFQSAVCTSVCRWGCARTESVVRRVCPRQPESGSVLVCSR